MNREILFRGKALKTNEWVYGDYLYMSNYRGRDGNYPSIWDQRLYYEPIEIIQGTLGQYTEETDHFTSKIFEGDILSSYLKGQNFAVVFHGGCFKVKQLSLNLNESMWGTLKNFLELYKNVRYNAVRVIGNIHDNPELLNKESVL